MFEICKHLGYPIWYRESTNTFFIADRENRQYDIQGEFESLKKIKAHISDFLSKRVCSELDTVLVWYNWEYQKATLLHVYSDTDEFFVKIHSNGEKHRISAFMLINESATDLAEKINLLNKEMADFKFAKEREISLLKDEITKNHKYNLVQTERGL